MREKIGKVALLFLIFCTHITWAQKQEKIFYDKDWKGCFEAEAQFYRIVNFDANGKPKGKVTDYYISGELQSNIDGALFIDKENDENSKWIGKSIGFYKSKKKQFEKVHDNEGNILSHQVWYENGKLKSSAKYKNNELDGVYSTYHQNGKLEFRNEYFQGKPVDKWSLDCDEFGKCQKVFYDGFLTSDNLNDWPLLNENECYSTIIENIGLLMETKTDRGFLQLTHVPIEIENNFSIETVVSHQSGDDNSGEGLIFGFKDWSNYYYFYIASMGYFRIGAVMEGINMEFVNWSKTEYINQGSEDNLIKINKIGDKIFYSINGEIVSTQDFYPFRGNNVGFQIESGKKTVLFKRILIGQDVKKSNESISFSTSEWKGSGTGFLINSKGYIITNYHVIEDASEIEIDIKRGEQSLSYKAKVVVSDKQNDLALLRIEDSKFKPFLKLPYSFKFKISDVGTNVFALGYPLTDILGNEVKFTDGKISAKTGYQGDPTTYQISVPVQPGNSGGPLFDYDGNIVGIINAKIMEADNVSYAIKVSYVQNLIDLLSEDVQLPKENQLRGKSLTDIIKNLSDFVTLIKVR